MSASSRSGAAGLPPAPAPRWEVRPPPDPSVVARLQESLSLSRPLCALLAVRGVTSPPDARSFLRPLLPALGDPALLADAPEAAARIGAAIRRSETVLVHGDYDVDGICGAALLTRVIRELGGRAEAFVPHRIRDGYDFGPAGVEAAVRHGAGLVVTVDCGIRALDAVRAASGEGIDVVVTDHHAPGDVLPPAVAVVNPGRPDCPSPCGDLSGTGVAYQLCRLLAGEAGWGEEALHAHLDLVALATIADLVPLSGDNRTLVRYGLRALARSRKPGLRALMESTGVEASGVDAGKVGWVLAPRLNAAGRVGDADAALRLLMTEDAAEAGRLAALLERRNRDRRETDRRILDEALERLEAEFEPGRDFGVVLAGDGWHPGVIGIVASRVVERIHRPTVLVALDGDRGRGSARSVPGFHLARALSSCADHLERFGGHARAAGMDVRRARLEGFRRAFRDEARRCLQGEDLRPTLRIDLELGLSDATAELHDRLRYVGPFGIGNPRPVFLARGVRAAGPAREVGTGHLKLRLAGDGSELEAIGFGLCERIPPSSLGEGALDVVFQLRENEYRGRRTLQARLLDLRPSTAGAA